MISVKNNAKMIKEWKRIEEELLKAGVAKTRAWEKIGKLYNTTPHTVRYWVDERRRLRNKGRYQKEPYRKEYDRAYKYFTRHLSKYANQALEEGEILELEELSERLGEAAKKDPQVGRKIVMKPATVAKKIEEMFKPISAAQFKYLGIKKSKVTVRLKSSLACNETQLLP